MVGVILANLEQDLILILVPIVHLKVTHAQTNLLLSGAGLSTCDLSVDIKHLRVPKCFWNVKFQPATFTKSNIPPWMFFTFFKIVKMILNRAKHQTYVQFKSCVQRGEGGMAHTLFMKRFLSCFQV